MKKLKLCKRYAVYIIIILPKRKEESIEEIKLEFNKAIETIKLTEDWEMESELQFLNHMLKNEGTSI